MTYLNYEANRLRAICNDVVNDPDLLPEYLIRPSTIDHTEFLKQTHDDAQLIDQLARYLKEADGKTTQEIVNHLCVNEKKTHDVIRYAKQCNYKIYQRTWCNVAVHTIGLKFLKYKRFDGKLANDIYNIMKEDTGEWEPLTMNASFDAALDGKLVIAAKPALTRGHVAVIYPDEVLFRFSGKWQVECPRVAQVGSFNKITGVNYAFADMPEFFRLKS